MPMVSRKRGADREESETSTEEDEVRGTQKKRRRTPLIEDEDDESNEDADLEGNEDVDALDQTVKKLVRYVLACEYQRVSIKRAGITEKVIGKQRGSYRKVLAAAQEQLRMKFGMELVELPSKEKVTLKEKRAAQKSKGTSKPSASYVLSTVLPPEYRDSKIIPPSNINGSADEAAYVGLYTVICTLVALSPQGQMPDYKLGQMMARLNIDRNTGLGTKDDLLKKMKAQGYLHELKAGTADEPQTDYRVGPRGRLEVGNQSMISFVREVYNYSDATPDDLDKRLQRSLGMEPAFREDDGNGVAASEEGGNVVNSVPGHSTDRMGRQTRADRHDDDDDD